MCGDFQKALPVASCPLMDHQVLGCSGTHFLLSFAKKNVKKAPMKSKGQGSCCCKPDPRSSSTACVLIAFLEFPSPDSSLPEHAGVTPQSHTESPCTDPKPCSLCFEESEHLSCLLSLVRRPVAATGIRRTAKRAHVHTLAVSHGFRSGIVCRIAGVDTRTGHWIDHPHID